MVVKNIKSTYANCASCGSSSCISCYQPRTVISLKALERVVYKQCSKCGTKLGIREIKVEVVKMR
jgi:translation initiation factor 2 beta subunit (eIF-2beta)/eIF-5